VHALHVAEDVAAQVEHDLLAGPLHQVGLDELKEIGLSAQASFPSLVSALAARHPCSAAHNRIPFAANPSSS
jgi:hypothetical protein